MNPNIISGKIVNAAHSVHSALGPGLLESAYEEALAYELRKRGLRFARQVSIPLIYDGVNLGEAYRADFIVEDVVIVEIKSVEEVPPVAFRQVLTYLKLANLHLGLLINFNVPLIKDGIRRVVLGLPEADPAQQER